jgi:hypothetical protein
MRSNLAFVVSKFYFGNQEANAMPREAKLYVSSSGSAVRGFYKFRANIPPRWIKNARNSRKQIEPEIVKALRSVKSIRRNRPRAQVAFNYDDMIKSDGKNCRFQIEPLPQNRGYTNNPTRKHRQRGCKE